MTTTTFLPDGIFELTTVGGCSAADGAAEGEQPELQDAVAVSERPAAVVQMELTFNELGDHATAAQSSRTL